MAGDGSWRRSTRRAGVAVLVALTLLFAVQVGIEVTAAARIDDDGVEVVAEVLDVEDRTRSWTHYDETEVRFTTRDGEEVRTEVATQSRPELPVIRVRYDPDEPTRAESVEDPAVLWLEYLLAAVVSAMAAAIVALYPRLRAWRDRLAG